MGAAIMKSCLAGDPAEAPNRHRERLLHYDARCRYKQSRMRSLAKTMPPSFAAAVPRVNRRSAIGLKVPNTELFAKTFATRCPLQTQDHEVAKLRKSPPCSLSSEAATMSESSFVADSPSHDRRSHRTPVAGFRALLPDDYVLEGEIGKGITSVCHKCVRRSDGRHFACKIVDKKKLAPSSRKRLEVAAQLRREVDVLRRVNHPHVAKLEQSFEDSNYLILIMELLEGGELFDAIVNKGCFSEREAVYVARCLLSAIQHMHARGVVHRDLKPENMLLTRNPDGISPLTVKIIDFGFAKILREGSKSTSFLGTGGYLAPEILLRQAYDTSVDMWSFGVLVYLLLCGRLPFAASTQLQPAQSIQKLYKLTFPSRYWLGVSPVAIDFLRRVLVVNPSMRLTATEALKHPWLRA